MKPDNLEKIVAYGIAWLIVVGFLLINLLAAHLIGSVTGLFTVFEEGC